jgi:putative inorganic carbon (HCO3(-)) transporter
MTNRSESAKSAAPHYRSETKVAWLGALVFFALLAVIALSAVPYASADPWWEAVLEVSVFALAALAFIEIAINRNFSSIPFRLIVPVLALIAFAFLQTLSLTSSNDALLGRQTWRAISFDPYATRLWSIKMLAFLLTGLMLARYTSSLRRLRSLIAVITLVGVASALFGIFRQTTQRHDGFLFLSRLTVGHGYGQFINRNQFAFLAEMVLGTALGLLVSRGVKKETKLFFLAASVTVWTALILSISRGAILAMLCQVIFLAVVWATADMAMKTRNSSGSFVERMKQSRLLRVALLCGLLAAILTGTIWMGGEPLATRLETAESEMTGSTDPRAGTSRIEIWRSTWSLIKDHPVTGVGFGGYWTAIPQYHQASGEATPQEAHNDCLELAASGGIIGLALAIWFAIAFVRRTLFIWKTSRGYRKAAALGALTGIFGVAIHSLADFGLHNATNAIIFTALAVIAAGNIKPDDKLESSAIEKRNGAKVNKRLEFRAS